VTDEDRSAAPDDPTGRAESGSGWFFQDRYRPEDQTGGHQATAPELAEPGQSGSGAAYYGPFGPPPVDEPTQVISAYGRAENRDPGPSYGTEAPAPGFRADPYASAWAPHQSRPGEPASAAPPPTMPPRPAKRSRTGLILLLAALLAALVGTAAGYGGARLAQTGTTVPTATPVPRPSSTVSAGPQRTPVPPPPSQMDTVQVAAAALPSTVMIRVGSGGSDGTGSGFVLDAEGHIMTNNHVIAGAADGGRITVVFSDGARVRAELVGRSPSYDLAVIKLSDDHELTPMPIGDSEAVQVGESVVAIGSPLALASTVTQGIVSAKNRPVVVSSDGGADSPSAYINGIQTDAAINPGNSGGPLVDAGARVIGVNSAILALGQNRESTGSGSIGLGFAIPINQAMQIGELLIADGKATYPVIGVNVDSDDDGVRLSEVDPDGPADKAGLAVDDVVLAIDGQPVTSPEELIVAIRTHRPGDRVTLTFARGSQRDTAKVTLGSREG
jgi:putative serine protease PepD